jgi:hypothetical protein
MDWPLLIHTTINCSDRLIAIVPTDLAYVSTELKVVFSISILKLNPTQGVHDERQ